MSPTSTAFLLGLLIGAPSGALAVLAGLVLWTRRASTPALELPPPGRRLRPERARGELVLIHQVQPQPRERQ
jgi:hypothetical protein